MKIMSVDYGDRRTGIALSDIRGILASPLTVIKESYQPKLAKEIVSLAVDNDVRGKKRKDTVDAVSAVMILQSYLDKNK